MRRMAAGTRISVGLVCSMLGILTLAHTIGVLPDQENIDIRHRVQTSEALAFSTSAMLASNDRVGTEAVLSGLVKRREDLLSAAVVSRDEGTIIEVGEHVQNWPGDLGEASNDQFMQVPLSRPDDSEWGRIELRYTPVLGEGLLGSLGTQFNLLLLFCGPVGFIIFRTFLRVVLKNLDPSKAVPRRVQEALDILAEGLMIVGVDGRVLLANNALATMTGNTPERMIGIQASKLGFVLNADGKGFPWMKSLEEQRSLANVSMLLDAADGTQRVFNVNCSPLLGNEGKYRGVMVTFDDVTRLEQNKAELRTAKEDAETANQAKSDILANMSHEIRNPMNAIVGFTDILRRGLEDGPQTRIDYLNTIHSSGTHLLDLINDILDLSKIEAGRMELEIRECSPWQIVSDVVAVMQAKAQEQKLLLEIDVRGQIPQTIQSDSMRLRQILMNLVGNAIKFTHQGSVSLVAELEDSAGQPQLKFEVIDTGIGMTPEQCDRIFEEFVQADSSVTRRFGGTGLGLAISKRLTEALGGMIEVTSSPDKGSTFSFSVETGDLTGIRMLDRRQATESLRTDQSQRTGLQIHFKPARVLVTDDTPANRKLVDLVLRQAGLTVDEAEDGLAAVNMVADGHYDLLLMDMQMPVMDGFTATSRLRESGVELPIIALTANVMQSDRERCELAGCTGFLTKPIDIDVLLATLAEFLPTCPAPPQVQSTSPESARTQPAADPANPPPSAEKSISTDLSRQTVVPGRSPIQSTLPTEIPEFRDIVDRFVDSLDPMTRQMQQAWNIRDFEKLMQLSHKLKGTGGAVGFAEFTRPAEQLQQRAQHQVEDDVEGLLLELQELSAAVQRPDVLSGS